MNRLYHDKIKTRGHYAVTLRPIGYESVRVERDAEMEESVRNACVDISGWDFPHWDTHTRPVRGERHVGQDSSWRNHLELWRLFRSGQFFYAGGFRGDWTGGEDGRGPAATDRVLDANDLLFRTLEVVLFTGRLYQRPGLACDAVTIAIELRQVAQRRLSREDPRFVPLRTDYVAAIPSLRWERSQSVAEVLAQPRSVAAEAASAIFEKFGWDVSADKVAGMQRIVAPP